MFKSRIMLLLNLGLVEELNLNLISILEKVLVRRGLFRATITTMIKVVPTFCTREDVLNMNKKFMRIMVFILTLKSTNKSISKP